ncbi:hypothetical protein OCH239_18745 [Roseivivax halodurans JCM 10272]|uniref:Type I secretion system permease/ATPase n=1 Tax=Roseivivax halodurans JCM 10272 TaxID=1449350 RepID=X7E9W8_9RHOB|nr:hypothetical protein OCH239_18745 [Roseivivax halodurans JCM 10272]
MTVGFFSMVINVLMLAAPLYMLQVYDRVLGSGRVETLIMLTLMLGGALAAMALLDTLRQSLTVRLGAWFTGALGPDMLDIGMRARLDGSSAGGQGLRDLSQIQSFVATQGMIAFFDFPWTPVFIGVIWVLHPLLGTIALAAALILLSLSIANEVATRGLLHRANASQIEGHKLAESAIDHAEVVRAMGMAGAMTTRWQARNTITQSNLTAASERSGYFTGFVKFIRLFAQSLVLGAGAWLVLRGEATPGVMIAGSILLGRALAPVDMAMAAWKNFSSARLAYGRLKLLVEAFPPEPASMELPTPRGRLTVQDLTVHGPTGAVLKRVSFDIQPGEVVAVIGPSAAGKSTLCRSIVGLARPTAGTVSLDGVRIQHWGAEALGSHIGFLPQDVGLFAGTIRENIARMADAEDAEVIEAADRAGAHEMISQLPQGYETELGERGAGLSGGQRQRVALARAVFGAPALIVLDEPNANLDQAGEAALSSAILNLKECGAALLIVGHRPSTLAQSDKILLLRAGVAQAFGPRAEVLGKLHDAKVAKIGNGRTQEVAAEDRPSPV